MWRSHGYLDTRNTFGTVRAGAALLVATTVLMAYSFAESAAPTTAPAPTAAPAPATKPADAKPSDASGPKIDCDAPVFDFGSVVNTKSVEHTFVLKNTGKAPLEIAGTSTSCGCTVATMEKKSLAPGETAEVKATLSLTSKTGVITKSIFVRCNDTSLAQGLYTLTLKGSAVALIAVDPISVLWGTLPKDKEESKTVTVQTTLPNVTFKVTGVEVKPSSSLPPTVVQNQLTASANAAGAPRISAGFETIEEGKSYKVTVKTIPPLEEGSLAYDLHVHTDHPDSPDILIRVAGTVLGELGVMPQVIDVPAPGENVRPISRFVKIVPGTVKEFKVLDAKTSAPGVTPVISPRPNNVVYIELKNLTPSKDLEGKSLVITTDAPTRKEITIPFKVRVLPVLNGQAPVPVALPTPPPVPAAPLSTPPAPPLTPPAPTK